MNAARVSAGVVHAAMEAAGLLQSPESAAEYEVMATELARLGLGLRKEEQETARLRAERHATNDALAQTTEALRATETERDALRARVGELVQQRDALLVESATAAEAQHAHNTAPGPDADPAESAAKLRGLLAPAAVPEPVLLVGYRASHEGIAMGLYTTIEAAREHCEAEAQYDPMPNGVMNWVLDEGDSVEELTVGGVDTGYVVTPLTVAAVYDPEADA